MTTLFGRVAKATGLLGKARALFHGLGPEGEHPSRVDPETQLWRDIGTAVGRAKAELGRDRK